MDLEKLAAVAAAECVRQEATEPDDLMFLLMAYSLTLRLDKEGELKNPELVSWLCKINEVLLGGAPTGGFRKVPVAFANGGTASAPQDVGNHMYRWSTISDFVPEHAYRFTRSFLQIHPFLDGNGRTAWLLYNWIKGSLEEPVPLPDFNF